MNKVALFVVGGFITWFTAIGTMTTFTTEYSITRGDRDLSTVFIVVEAEFTQQQKQKLQSHLAVMKQDVVFTSHDQMRLLIPNVKDDCEAEKLGEEIVHLLKLIKNDSFYVRWQRVLPPAVIPEMQIVCTK